MRKIIFLFTLVVALLNATETINYNGEIVNIKLSNDSWNRLIFDSDVNAEPIFSKEKNIDVYKANKSVFIKFKPMVKLEVLEKEEKITDIDYSISKKSELFVSTANGTYSFTIEPTQTDAKTYLIQNLQQTTNNLLKFEMDSARKVLKDITKNIFLNEMVENYEKVKLSSETLRINNLNISPKYIFKGKLYSAYLYDITALEDITNIDERIFLQLNHKNKRSIALKDKFLLKNQLTSLVIVVGN